MSTPHMPSSRDEFDVSEQELLAGDLTAAMLQAQRDALSAGASPTASAADDTVTAQDQLPPALAARIVATGEAFVRAQAVPPVSASASVPSSVPVSVPAAPAPTTPRPSAVMAWTGWLAAAALLVFVMRSNGANREGAAPTGQTVAAVDPRVALRDSLLATPGIQRRTWTPTTDSAAVTASGELLWDPATQRGIMRFTGLVPNDRDEWQYQLWIFDAERDERYPVDGGVFDIPTGPGEVLVPIRARLPVTTATLFAVTVETAGGVVVSSRERIAVTARL